MLTPMERVAQGMREEGAPEWCVAYATAVLHARGAAKASGIADAMVLLGDRDVGLADFFREVDERATAAMVSFDAPVETSAADLDQRGYTLKAKALYFRKLAQTARGLDVCVRPGATCRRGPSQGRSGSRLSQITCVSRESHSLQERPSKRDAFALREPGDARRATLKRGRASGTCETI